ncbi:MAG: putative lipopolysaccharide heptosyltransferase III [Burkholderiales bacterium]|nr:putative lipopolysaccharide heptosyltransferase III [Burkholderiales bacterium]
MKHDGQAVDWQQVRRVLVVKLRHHGDVLLTTPVLRAIKQQYPHIEVDALVYDETHDMLADNPHLTQLHTIKKSRALGGGWAKFKYEITLWRSLKARRYDVLINLTEHNRGALLARTLAPRWSISQDGPFSRTYKRSFTHLFRPQFGNNRHAVERNLDGLRVLGLYPAEADKGLLLVPGAAAEQKITALLAAHQLQAKQFIVVHPGSRWAYKAWPARQVAGLIDRLQHDGHRIVLTGSPDAAERELVNQVLAQLKQRDTVVDLVGQLSLRELGACIAASRLLFGVDSVPMHMAAALQTPSVALFGPSGHIEWAPWRAPHTLVYQDMSCRPCGMKGCGDSGYSECLATLPVDMAYAAVVRQLQKEHA